MAFQLQFFGATERVTGSLYVLTAGQSRIVLECGLVQGSADEEARNREAFPFNAEEIDAVVISHSHIDHSGASAAAGEARIRGPNLYPRSKQGAVRDHVARLRVSQ